MQTHTECESCGGDGRVMIAKLYPTGHSECWEDCSECGGSGEIEVINEVNTEIMTTTHTPGPWELDFTWEHRTRIDPTQWIEIQSKGKTLAEVKGQHEDIPEYEMHANAKIMVMAPQMLEAIKEIYALSDKMDSDINSTDMQIWKICNDTFKLLEDATGSH